MTETELNNQIDVEITTQTDPSSITPTIVGENLKDIVSFSEPRNKTYSTTTLSATQQVLPSYSNSVTFTGGKAYLPATSNVGTEILVIANSNSIEIYANEANTNKMFVTFNTFINKVTLAQYEMYRFTYIGFGAGTDGFWKAELLQ